MSNFVPASRVSRIKVSPSTAAAARARELKAAGRDIVDLTVAGPDFDTPENVKAAAHTAIDRGETQYTPVNGNPALRKARSATIDVGWGFPTEITKSVSAAVPSRSFSWR